MAISRVHTWSAGEVLLASDLNAEYNNILNNAADLVSPFTKAISLGGFAINFDAANTIAFTATTSGISLTGGTVREPTEDTLTAFATGGQANAIALSVAKKFHRISVCATAADSAKLPTSTAGQAHYIRNDGAASAQIYGTSPDTVNGVATGTGVALPAGTGAWYVCTTAGNWTTSVITSGIQASTLTTKGDLLVATASATVARQGVGSDGQVPVANSNLTNGIGYATAVLRSYLAGLGLSTAGSSATMSIAAGQCVDTTNVSMMTLAAFSKTTSAWALGSAAGGLDTGAIANSTWYHFYVIQRVDTGVVDALISLSATAPTMPTNYTLKRRIGSGLTNGSAQWVLFTQDGDYFRWSASVLDVNTTNPGTAAVTATLASVPTGVNVIAMFNLGVADTTPVNNTVQFSDLAAADEAPSATAAPLGLMRASIGAAGIYVNGGFQIRTNTSAQIRYRSTASDGNVIVRIATLGWIDYRGRNA